MPEQPARSDKPIFLDQTGQRWTRLRIVLLGLATAIGLLPFVLALSILKVEALPEQSGEPLRQVTTVSPLGYQTPTRRLPSAGFGRSTIGQ